MLLARSNLRARKVNDRRDSCHQSRNLLPTCYIEPCSSKPRFLRISPPFTRVTSILLVPQRQPPKVQLSSRSHLSNLQSKQPKRLNRFSAATWEKLYGADSLRSCSLSEQLGFFG